MKNLVTIGVPCALALAGLAYLGLSQTSARDGQEGRLEGASSPAQPGEVVRERVIAPEPAVEKAAVDPFAAQEATAQADPWGHFKGKGPLKIQPDRILPDGSLEYDHWPGKVAGKFTYLKVRATPTPPLPILPDEIPEAQRKERLERAERKLGESGTQGSSKQDGTEGR